MEIAARLRVERQFAKAFDNDRYGFVRWRP
jgi:hypothetical protein